MHRRAAHGRIGLAMPRERLLCLCLVLALTQGSERSDRLFLEGNDLFGSGDLAAAKSKYEQSIELASSGPAWSNLGGVLQAQGDPAAALQAYSSAIAIDDSRPKPHYNKGVCLYSLGRTEEALASFLVATSIDDAYVNAHYNIGVAHQELGDPLAAGHAYAKTLSLDPLHKYAYLNYCNVLASMGSAASETCYSSLLALHLDFVDGMLSLAGLHHRSIDASEHDKALELYQRVLQQDPANNMAAHGLAALTSAESSASTAAYVRDLFDTYAHSFDESLLSLKYDAPQIIASAVSRADSALQRQDHKYRMLDLGAGTGLACQAMRPVIGSAVGVDLSAKMLRKAGLTGCYASTHVAEMGAFLQACLERFDLVVAADVLVYAGDLAQVLADAARVMSEGALFAFTVEVFSPDVGEARGWKLLSSGRFAHSVEHVRAAAHASALQVVLSEDCTPRHDRGRPIDGHVFVLRRALA